MDMRALANVNNDKVMFDHYYCLNFTIKMKRINGVIYFQAIITFILMLVLGLHQLLIISLCFA